MASTPTLGTKFEFMNCTRRLQRHHRKGTLYVLSMVPSSLKIRWDELSQLELERLSSIPGLLVESATALHKREDERHIYQFLMGFRHEFQSLHTPILNTSSLLPKMGDVYAMIEEEKKQVKLIPKPVDWSSS